MTPAQKKIRYLATHRGMREADLILGGFAEDILEKLTPPELLFMDTFLALPDAAILNWLLKKQPLPEGFDHPLLEKLQTFAQTLPLPQSLL